MDDAEGLRMIRYSGGGVELDKTIINRVMLRFRPIAPKPPSGDQKSGTPSNEKMRLLCSGLRRKRKYVRVAKNNMCKTKKKVLSDQVKEKEKEKEVGAFKTGVTLQLLPGRNDGLEESSESKALRCNLQPAMPAIKEHGDKGDKDNHHQEAISSVIFKSTQLTVDGVGGQDQSTALNVMVRQKKVTMESWVTVECVSEVLDKCMVGRRLECTDVERVRILQEDTCPGFVSDGSNKVHWVNDAFKRVVTTVREGNEDQERWSLDIMVWLVVKEKLLEFFSSYSAFSCWVRLQNSWQKDKCLNMVPCDVWRMNCGGFAWRLDVEAALSLGR